MAGSGDGEETHEHLEDTPGKRHGDGHFGIHAEQAEEGVVCPFFDTDIVDTDGQTGNNTDKEYR